MIMTSTKRIVIETHHTTVAEAKRMLYITVESLVWSSADLNDRGARTNIMAGKEKPRKGGVKKTTQGKLFFLTLLMKGGRRRAHPQEKKKKATEKMIKTQHKTKKTNKKKKKK